MDSTSKCVIEGYVNKKLSIGEISTLFGLTHSKVYWILTKNKVKMRTISEGYKLIIGKKPKSKRKSPHTELNNKDWLEQKYLKEELSTTQISRMISCSNRAILDALYYFNIPVRSLSEAKRGTRNPMYGGLSKRHKQRISKSMKGMNKGKQNPMWGKQTSEKQKSTVSTFMKKRWKDINYKQRTLRKTRKGCNIKPNKVETIFINICHELGIPFHYVGDGTLWIENINPDFIHSNGEKVAVEVFGDYWHSPLFNRNIQKTSMLSYRKQILKKHGWRLIVLWESDLKKESAKEHVLNTLKKEGIIC